MNLRRTLLVASCLAIAWSGVVRGADCRNVVLIVADDLGWADLGCYGSTYHRTPNLDRFAGGAMRFTHGYAACPVCSPSRVALLTGRYPQRYNITDWLPGRPDRSDQKLSRPTINLDLPAGTPTIASVLKKSGFATAHIGKWHLGGASATPSHFGFDLNIAGDHTGTCLSYFAPFKDKNGRFMPGLENAPDGQYLTDRLTDEATKFIESNKSRRFFLHLAHYAVHTPMKAKPELTSKYRQGKHGEQGNPAYAAMLESLDESVGQVLAKLDELHLTENTLVIFTSDNGGLATLEGMPFAPTINSPLREGKGYLYEGGIRVPLIVRWPGASKPKSTSSQAVCGIDMAPTILDACGIETKTAIDGESLRGCLGGGATHREALFWHYPHYANQGSRPGGAIRHGSFKLIEYYETGRRELFDLSKDPGEGRNLAHEQPEVTARLAARLDRWRSEIGARMMTPNPRFVPNPQNKDGTIVLPARTANVHGKQLRFEPLPHKNTLGFWIDAADWASWDFTVTHPGKFRVTVLQGCGKDQGGSEVEIAVGDQRLTFVVEDTGHFQNFKRRDIGSIPIYRARTFSLEVRAKKKAAEAVMDIREIRLTPIPE